MDRTAKTVTKQITLPEDVGVGQPILGVTAAVIDSEMILASYKNSFTSNPIGLIAPPTIQPFLVPYSDSMAPMYTSSVFGNNFALVANTLFWLWFINFNVGIFNALPIGPLDGGQMYGALIEKRVKSKAIAKNANTLLTLIMVAIVAAAILLPYAEKLFIR